MSDDFVSADINLDDYDGLTDLQKRFIAAYIGNLGNKLQASKMAGCSWTSVMNWFRDETFVRVVEECQQVWTDNLERSARFRALVDSDSMLKFLLEAEKPMKYDAKIRAQQHALNHLNQDNNIEVVLVDSFEDEDETVAENDNQRQIE